MNWTVTWLPVDSISSLTFRPKPQYFTVKQHGQPQEKRDKEVLLSYTSLFSLTYITTNLL